MRYRNKRRFLFHFFSISLLLCYCAAIGCDDESSPPYYKDQGTEYPDLAPADISTMEQPDLYPSPDYWPSTYDGSRGGPFGCHTDNDCFGQKCCPTPWGVKLCAPSCDFKP